jgi:hypothetical protein
LKLTIPSNEWGFNGKITVPWQPLLLLLINGITIYYRFVLVNRYRSTQIAHAWFKQLFTFFKACWSIKDIGSCGFYTLWYFTLSANAHYNRLFNPDLPLRSTTPFGAKITRADSTLETAPLPLFPDPVSRSGSDHLLYYLRTR